jgi:leucine dehydrogenase
MDRYTAQLDHEEIVIRRGERSGLYTLIAVHSTAIGPSLGGCRMWHYPDARLALRDVMRLSEGMTYKAAVAGTGMGGGKGVIMAPEDGLAGDARRDALLDFGDAVNQLEGRYLTAEDVGISVDDVAIVGEVTPHVSALPREQGGSGDPSPSTALGVFETIRTCAERALGSAELDGRSVSVIGLGHVGGELARLLTEAGAVLTVADVNQSKRALAEELGATWTSPGEALLADVDIVAPCALGGFLDHESVPRLRCRAIAGAANNQLADTSVEHLLVERGILWAPDFVANAGGIINIAVEFEPGGYDEERAERRVRAIGDTMRTIFDEAEASRSTPLAAAMAIAHRRINEAAGLRRAASPGAPAA